MITEQRRKYIRDSVMNLAEQAVYWYKQYSRDDIDAETENDYNQKFKYFNNQYRNLISEFFDYDLHKSIRYFKWSPVESCKLFLVEN